MCRKKIFYVVVWQTTSKNSALVRATRAARVFPSSRSVSGSSTNSCSQVRSFTAKMGGARHLQKAIRLPLHLERKTLASTIIFLHSTNQIIVFWGFLCLCRRLCSSSLLTIQVDCSWFLEQKLIFQLGTLYPHGIIERLSFH